MTLRDRAGVRRGGRRVVLHVGLPKTGTSFLQQVLSGNAALLAERGVRVVDPEARLTFKAVLDVRRAHAAWGRTRAQVKGSWSRLAAAATSGPGTAVLSSEHLCGATAEEVREILGSFGDARVDVVVTVRDPWRQLAAEWQEGVKHGRHRSWRGFLASVLDEPHSRQGERFWRVQDPVSVVERWGAGLPPGRVHVITVPPAGADPGLLWRRFAEVLDCGEVEPVLPGPGINATLGVAQTELLRRVNRRYRRRGRAAVYGQVVKRTYARRILATFPRSRVRFPDDRLPAVQQVADRWRSALESSGHPVVGSLDELTTAPVPDETLVDPDTLTQRQLLTLAVDSTALLLSEVERLQDENARLRKGRG